MVSKCFSIVAFLHLQVYIINSLFFSVTLSTGYCQVFLCALSHVACCLPDIYFFKPASTA